MPVNASDSFKERVKHSENHHHESGQGGGAPVMPVAVSSVSMYLRPGRRCTAPVEIRTDQQIRACCHLLSHCPFPMFQRIISFGFSRAEAENGLIKMISDNIICAGRDCVLLKFLYVKGVYSFSHVLTFDDSMNSLQDWN